VLNTTGTHFTLPILLVSDLKLLPPILHKYKLFSVNFNGRTRTKFDEVVNFCLSKATPERVFEYFRYGGSLERKILKYLQRQIFRRIGNLKGVDVTLTV